MKEVCIAPYCVLFDVFIEKKLTKLAHTSNQKKKKKKKKRKVEPNNDKRKIDDRHS